MTTDFFCDNLARVPIVAILRGMAPAPTVDLALACWEAGISLVEVPANTPEGLRALEAVASHPAAEGRHIGAGTIYTTDLVRQAHEAGARFLVAPGINADAVQEAADRQLPYLPGVATASDIQQALSLGISTVKAFPASSLGPQWVKSMLDPFPDVAIIATGGVGSTNARTFLKAGALGLGVGGELRDKQAISRLIAVCHETANTPSRPANET